MSFQLKYTKLIIYELITLVAYRECMNNGPDIEFHYKQKQIFSNEAAEVISHFFFLGSLKTS